jgi:hypothetical protein
MPPSRPTPPVALGKLVETSRQDLAKRLSVAVTDITLVEAAPVVWSNSSLGCPQPGMVYADVLTPGFLVVLRSGDRQHEYHAGSNQVPAYCKNPLPPSSRNPDRT